MAKFTARAKNGGLEFSDYSRKEFKKFLMQNEGARIEITPILPESRNQRKFYHGAVIPLWAYLDGKDYKSSEILADYHEIAKLEFLPKIVLHEGKATKIGQSTKKRLGELIERLVYYLEGNYGIKREDVLNPEHYKYYMDVIYSTSIYDTYIDYMQDIGKLDLDMHKEIIGDKIEKE